MYDGIHDPKIAIDDALAEDRIMAFVNKWKNDTSYLNNGGSLLIALNEYAALRADYMYWTKSDGYYRMLSEITQDDEIKALSNKSSEKSKDLMVSLNFFTISLKEVSKKQQSMFLNDECLSVYHHFLALLFDSAKHTLSNEEEKIISIMSKTGLSNWIKMIEDFLSLQKGLIIFSDWTEKEVSLSELWGYINNQDPYLREQAAMQFYRIINDHVDVAEVEINSVLEHKKIIDKLRDFERPESSRHLKDNVPTDVVNALVDAVSSANSIANDYYTFKAELLGFDKFQYHEKNLAYVGIGDEKMYTFEEAYTIVKKTLSKVDKEFEDFFTKYVSLGRIDALPKEWKRGGGFNVWFWKNVGSAILMNFTGKLIDIITLAHEMWHAIHAERSCKQNALYYGHGWMFVAEVGSTFIENFVYDTLIEDADNETKLSLLVSRLDLIVSWVFRQIAGYRFEQELHKTFRETWYVSSDKIWIIFKKYMSEYMWPSVEQNEWSENRWVHWRHFRYFFYIYTYASGDLISQSLHALIKENPSFIHDIKQNFYSVGWAKSPVDIFASMGLDITKKEFWQKWVTQIWHILEQAKTLARKLWKIK